MINWADHRVCVTGGAGFLGHVVCQKLLAAGLREKNLLVPRRSEFDLSQESAVELMYRQFRPDVVIHLAAEVGGIGANMANPGRFFYVNMAMGLHLVEHARRAKIRKFVHTGTVCAYPKYAPVPFRESDIWNGYPEETNAPYGVAKKAIFVMLDAYHRQYGLPSTVVVPVNLYGPRDNFNPASSHVIPALIRKCEFARRDGDDKIICWGTGKATREFLYVDDAADAIVLAATRMEEPTPINLGTGQEIAIGDLIRTIARLCDFQGRIEFDASKPDGQPRRCLDTSRAKELLGWQASTPLEEGLRRTIAWWREEVAAGAVHASAGVS